MINFHSTLDTYNSIEMSLYDIEPSDIKLIKNKYNRIQSTCYNNTITINDLISDLRNINNYFIISNINNETSKYIMIALSLMTYMQLRLLIHNNIFSIPISDICTDGYTSNIEEVLSNLNLSEKYHVVTDSYKTDICTKHIVSLECEISNKLENNNIEYLYQFNDDIVKYFNLFSRYKYCSIDEDISSDVISKYDKINSYDEEDQSSFIDSIVDDILYDCKKIALQSESMSIKNMDTLFNQYLALLVYLNDDLMDHVDACTINHVYIKYILKLTDEIRCTRHDTTLYQALIKSKHVLVDLSNICKGRCKYEL